MSIARTPVRHQHHATEALSHDRPSSAVPAHPREAAALGAAEQCAQVVRAQDAQLSELSSILKRHRQLGEAIGEEIEAHNEAIGRVQRGVDKAQRRLEGASADVKKI